MSDCFWSQTNVTSFHIGFNVTPQTQPVVFSANQFSCLINSKMSYKRIIMVTTYHLGVDDFWDIWETTVLEYSLNFLPVLWKAYSSKCFCFLVLILKFRQPQSHASNVCNVRIALNNLALKGALELVKLGQHSRSVYEDLIEKGEATC